jgi:hypothetical protein
VLLVLEDNPNKVGVRFDKPVYGGNNLVDLCEDGHGFFSNGMSLFFFSSPFLIPFIPKVHRQSHDSVGCNASEPSLFYFMGHVPCASAKLLLWAGMPKLVYEGDSRTLLFSGIFVLA